MKKVNAVNAAKKQDTNRGKGVQDVYEHAQVGNAKAMKWIKHGSEQSNGKEGSEQRTVMLRKYYS